MIQGSTSTTHGSFLRNPTMRCTVFVLQGVSVDITFLLRALPDTVTGSAGCWLTGSPELPLNSRSRRGAVCTVPAKKTRTRRMRLRFGNKMWRRVVPYCSNGEAHTRFKSGSDNKTLNWKKCSNKQLGRRRRIRLVRKPRAVRRSAELCVVRS